MWRFASALGVGAGILSLIMLARQALDFGVAAPLQTVLDYYHQIISFLLGWADAPLTNMVRRLSNWAGIDFHLYPHWKHVFVLMWLYVGGSLKVNWRQGIAPFVLLWGTPVALGASLAAGTVPPDDSNIYGVIFPVIGFFVFELGWSVWSASFERPASPYRVKDKTWSQIFGHYVTAYVLPVAALGALAVVAAWRLEGANVPSLSILALFVLGLAAYRLGRGIRYAFRRRELEGDWMQRFRMSASGRLGTLMFATIGGAALFVALNAGLKQAGF